MLIEQSAHSNRWRWVAPSAKCSFSLCGIIAAFAAPSPRSAFLVALILAFTAMVGAGIKPFHYLRVAAPALFFLATSSLSLLISLDFGQSGAPSLHPALGELPAAAQLCGRSLACLSALLFLAMTTPLSHIIALLRRYGVPDTLLDLMTLCHRTLFVLSEVIHETMTSQSARLGYATATHSLRSMGGLIANLTVQVWQRSQTLHLAAMARNNDGALRFLEHHFERSLKQNGIAAVAGVALITLTVLSP